MSEVQNKFRIVVGVDFRDTTAFAIREAISLARLALRVELHFGHVVYAPPHLHSAHSIEALSQKLGRAMWRLERFTRGEIAAIIGAPHCGYDVAFHVRVGQPSHELHQLAVDVDADLIVVGAVRSTSGVRRLLGRTLVEQLLREARVPVVVARPKDYSGWAPTQRPDQARPGEDLRRGGLTSYAHVELLDAPRTTHVAGLI